MEVLRRCPLAIAQRLVHCAIALSTAVQDRVTKTMSVAPLLMNNLDNSKQKTSNLLSPAPPPYSWSLLGKSEGPAPPPSSKISWSFDLAWNPVKKNPLTYVYVGPCWKQHDEKDTERAGLTVGHSPQCTAWIRRETWWLDGLKCWPGRTIRFFAPLPRPGVAGTQATIGSADYPVHQQCSEPPSANPRPRPCQNAPTDTE